MSYNAPDYENNLAFDPDINTMPRCDIEELKSQVKHLKDLLKECKHLLNEYAYTFNCGDCAKSYRLINLINKAIGASKND